MNDLFPWISEHDEIGLDLVGVIDEQEETEDKIFSYKHTGETVAHYDAHTDLDPTDPPYDAQYAEETYHTSRCKTPPKPTSDLD